MSKQMNYETALSFARKKHDGQFRIGGNPYITHPIAVSLLLREQGYGLEYQIAGLFHDLLEDTDASIDEIIENSNERVACAVQLLTKQKDYVMEEYVKGVLSDPMAKTVKAADRLHNLYSAVVADEDFKRRYLLETIDWYWDFSVEIRNAAKELAKTLKNPMSQQTLLYEPIEFFMDKKGI